MGERYDTGLKRNNGKPRIVQRWVPDAEMWERGRNAFEMRANGASYVEIERAVSLFPNANNPSSSYSSFFKNRIYIGEFHYGGQVFENFVPALTTPEIWEKVQARYYSRPRRGEKWPLKKHPKAGKTAYLMSGLCECIYCGSAMHGEKNVRGNGRTWRFYRCSGKKFGRCPDSSQIAASKLEPAVLNAVLSYVLTPEYVNSLVAKVSRQLANTDKIEMRIDIEKQKLQSIDRAVANLIKFIENGRSGAVEAQLHQRETERMLVASELEKLEQLLEHSKNIRVDEQAILDVLTNLSTSLKSGEIKVQQYILQQAVEKIEVGRGYARLQCTFPLERVYLVPPTGFEPVSQP